MSCGGHKDGSPNANSLRISEVAAATGEQWDNCAYIYHGLVSDAKAEFTGNEAGRKSRDKDVQQGSETRARALLDQAVTNPETLPEGYTETHKRLAHLSSEAQEPTPSELKARLDALSLDPEATPEDLHQARAEYYAALDGAMTDEDAILPVDLPEAALKNGILMIGNGTLGQPEYSEEATEFASLLENIRNTDSQANSMTATEQVEAAIVARNVLTEARDSAALISANVVDRLDTQKLRTVTDSATGVSLSPIGGVRYSGWQHEAIQQAVGARIAEQRGLPEDAVQSAIAGYTDYAGIDYYRGPALRALGLKARDYAKVNPEPRRTMIKFPDYDDAFIPGGAAVAVRDNQAALEAMPGRIRDLAARVEDMPLDQAVRELASVERSIRSLNKVTISMESDAYSRLAKEGPVSTTYGDYKAYQTTPSDRWDPTIEPVLISQVAKDKGIDPVVTGIAVRDFLEVGHAGRYKVKSLKAAEIDPDDYRSKGNSTRKIQFVEPAVEEEVA